ncbi:hypothetical protein ACFCVW_28725 [Bacillus mobilis]|uniref:hypothetical protein n=1 Tax=Bacillus mobilis TaxID=2026190 RepID=UPI0035DC61DF
MPKRNRSLSIKKKLKDDFGQGFGIDYKPWNRIQDVSSLGRSIRLKGIKVPRKYEFFRFGAKLLLFVGVFGFDSRYS